MIERLEAGKSIATICKELGVSKKALHEWLESPERAGLASRARVRAAREFAAETIEIADTAKPEEVAVARLRIESRRWVAAKWNAAEFGDNKTPQVVVNIGDLHLRALKQTPTITIEATPVADDVTDVEELPGE